MHRRRIWSGVVGMLFGIAVTVVAAPASHAAVPHVVQPGETMWSIAAANNFTTRAIAAYNGLSEDAQVVEGQTIQIPTEAEGAATLESAGLEAAQPAEPAAPAPAPAEPAPSAPTDPALATTTEAGAPLGHIPSPSGELHLEAGAASAWNAMREEGLRLYGIDIYPAGPLSAYRTPAEQGELYQLYLSGQGAPANPPGTSTHESGTAVDLASEEMLTVIEQLGPGYGWAKTEAPAEWWHVNYVG